MIVQDFSLVSFHTLCIEEKESVYKLLKSIDKANGFVFGGLTTGNEDIMQLAMKVDQDESI